VSGTPGGIVVSRVFERLQHCGISLSLPLRRSPRRRTSLRLRVRPTANSEGDPVVALGGAVATAETLKQLHQTMDAVSICKPVTKFSATVAASDTVGEYRLPTLRRAHG
jgi:hypothetical protein